MSLARFLAPGQSIFFTSKLWVALRVTEIHLCVKKPAPHSGSTGFWFQGLRGTPVSSLAAQEEERLAMGQRQKAQDIPSSHRQQARATALAHSLPWAGPPAP